MGPYLLGSDARKGPRIPSTPTSSSSEWFLHDSSLTDSEPHLMGLAVVGETQDGMGSRCFIWGSWRRRAGLLSIPHDLDFVFCLTAAQRNLEPLPIRWNAGVDMQFLCPLFQA
jgi:hypothetical protein